MDEKNEILKEQSELSGEIWLKYKNYCLTHDYDSEDFPAGLVALADQYSDKYAGTPLDSLQKHLWAGFINSFYDLRKGKHK